jgi:tetrahydromethanopterin S-methyltransferase subunit F
MTKAFKQMTPKEQHEKVIHAEKMVNQLYRMVQEFAREHDLEPNTMAAALIGMTGGMIGDTAGKDIEKQESLLKFVMQGIRISLMENGYRPLDDSVPLPPWMKH